MFPKWGCAVKGELGAKPRANAYTENPSWPTGKSSTISGDGISQVGHTDIG